MKSFEKNRNVSFYESYSDKKYHVYINKDHILGDGSSFHHSVEFVYLLKGEIKSFIGDDSRINVPGDLIFVDSYQYHYYKQISEEIEAVIIVISEKYLSSFHHHYKNKSFETYMDDKDKNARIYKIIDYWLKDNDKSILRNHGYASMLLSEIINLYGLIDKKENNNDIISKVFRYIDENYTQQINLNSISSHFGYSSDYISKIFKKTINKSVNDYITDLRLNLAHELMRDDKYTKLEICYRAGFNSPATFYRALAKHNKKQ